MGNWTTEIKHAIREIRRHPVYAFIIVATLAVGIGANSAVLSVINAVSVRDLPFREAARLLWTSSSHPGNESGGNSISYREVQDIAERSQLLEQVEPMLDWIPVTVVDDESSRSSLASFVSHRYFDLLGAEPTMGRLFSPEENRFGAAMPVAVVSERLWRNDYGADPAILGKSIRVNDVGVSVVGVMSSTFYDLNSQWSDGTDIWLPIYTADDIMGRNYFDSRTRRSMNGIALMRPGVSSEAALDEVRTIARQLEQEYPETQEGFGLHVEPLRESFFGDLHRPSFLAWAAAGLVLLVAGANVAGLLLIRGFERRREIAARAMLGATRGRLFAMLLIEPILLGVLGLASGLWLAELITRWFVVSEVVHLPGFMSIALDPYVFALTTVLSLVVVVVFAAIPSRAANRFDLRDALTQGGRRAVGDGHTRLRSSLIVFEIALATTLVVVALLAITSFLKLQDTELGYQSENLTAFRFDLRSQRYNDIQARARFGEELQREFEAQAGIDSAVLWGPNMLGRGYINASVEATDQPAARPSDFHRAGRHHVGVDGLRKLGLRLAAGREFNATDTEGAPNVVIVSESLARRVWPGESALDKRLRFFDTEFDVVGVASDALHRPRFVGDDEIYAMSDLQDIYLPYAQYPQQRSVLIVLTSTELTRLAELAHTLVGRIDPEVPLYDFDSMAARLQRDDAVNGFIGELLGGFAAIAMLLSAIGIYGLLQFLVQRRFNEFGVRMSVGAVPSSIAKLILEHAVVLAGLGITLGLVGGSLFSQLIVSMLYEVSQFDWRVFAGAGVCLFAAAVAATLLPALRAARIDPIVALRSE